MEGLEFFPSGQMVVSPTGAIGYGSAPPMAFIAPAPTPVPSTGYTQPVQMSHAIASPSDVLSGVSLLTPAPTSPPGFGDNYMVPAQTVAIAAGGAVGSFLGSLNGVPGGSQAGGFIGAIGTNYLYGSYNPNDPGIAAWNNGVSSGDAFTSFPGAGN